MNPLFGVNMDVASIAKKLEVPLSAVEAMMQWDDKAWKQSPGLYRRVLALQGQKRRGRLKGAVPSVILLIRALKKGEADRVELGKRTKLAQTAIDRLLMSSNYLRQSGVVEVNRRDVGGRHYYYLADDWKERIAELKTIKVWARRHGLIK